MSSHFPLPNSSQPGATTNLLWSLDLPILDISHKWNYLYKIWGFPGGASGNPLQYSCLENPLDRGTWRVTVHEVAKSWT